MTAAATARSRRLARLRETAPPILRDAVKPTRASCPVAGCPDEPCDTGAPKSLDCVASTAPGVRAICRTNAWRTALRPRAQARNSRRFLRRASDRALGVALICRGLPRVEPTPQALSFLRPFARRARMIRRPPTVDMRARKPWRLLRTSRLGWYVLFKAQFLVIGKGSCMSGGAMPTGRHT